MSDLQSLLEFAENSAKVSPSQREAIEALIEHGSMRKAASALGCSPSSVQGRVERIRKYAAMKGVAPDHDLHRPAAEGFNLSGYTIGDFPGRDEPVVWHKFSADKQAQFEAVMAAANAMAEDIPRLKPTPAPRATNANLCNLYTLSDAHVGSLADSLETQTGDWDIGIAERTLVGCFEAMVASAPRASECIVNILGDATHYESILATETPMNRNVLDSDTRYGRLVDAYIRIARRVVDMALQKHRKVTLLICEGNHDSSSSLVFRKMFSALYEREKRLTVHDFDLPYYAVQFGSCMIAAHHGHLKKMNELPLLFAAQFPKVWGESVKRYAHIGHKHHFVVQEYNGMVVTQHPTVAARDAHAARHGYLSNREAVCVTYHRTNGQVATNHVSPEMLDAA